MATDPTQNISNDVIEIFTDGSCKGNPGKGGWAALLRWHEKTKTISGGENDTTNNRMEVTAAIKALEIIKKPSDILIYTDSQYLKKGISEWIYSWRNNNWKTSNNKPVKNQDLWEALDKLTSIHNVQWKWVKGHAGHEENEIVDKLANLACEKAE